MARLKRIALGLLVAYAASMTLYASRKSAEVFLFRRIYERGPKTSLVQNINSYPLMMIAKDYGVDLTLLEIWSLRIADIQGILLIPAIVLFSLLGLGAALIHSPSRSKLDKE